MYLRCRPATVRMVDVWLDMLVNTKDPKMWDQVRGAKGHHLVGFCARPA